MKRPHIAIFTALANGHVYPVLGLCPELIKRGYRVSYATDSFYAPAMREVGVEPLVYRPPELGDTEDITKVYELSPSLWWEYCAQRVFPYFVQNARAIVSQLMPLYRSDPPDLILYDRISYAGRILSRSLECRAVRLCQHFAYYNGLMYRDQGVCRNPEPMLKFSDQLDEFFAAHGIEEQGNFWHTEALNLYFIPECFQHNAGLFDERSCFVGPCLNRQFMPVWRRIDAEGPVILVSDVSASGDERYFNRLIDAFEGSAFQVVLSLGKSFSPGVLRPLPRNFHINSLHASHLEILPHTALSISQGGMGTTLEALSFGVPVIALPPSPFHEEIAYRVTELGLGMHLSRKDVTEDSLKQSAERLVSDAKVAAQLQQMRGCLRGVDGARRAGEKIAAFLG